MVIAVPDVICLQLKSDVVERNHNIMHNVAIVLAAGSGKRMQSDVKKQYIEIDGKPLIYYALQTFEKSEVITDVILVTGADDIDYCKNEIVERFSFSKVRKIAEGGKERYHSVMAGLDVLAEMGGCDYVFIHDGARPFVDEEMLKRLHTEVKATEACVAAVKSKDTIKIANSAGYVVSTPNRNLTWIIQTPQVFEYELIKEAYGILKEEECGLPCQGIVVTDDAMVVETWTKHKVKLTEGSYENIKVTTPEDLITAEVFVKKRKWQ